MMLNHSSHLRIVLVALILSVFLSSVSTLGVSASLTTTADVSIMPPVHVALMVGETCYFYVNIYNVENLNAARFTITYNASTLQFSNIVQQSFFPAPPASNFGYQLDGSLGLLRVNLSLANPRASLSGNGTLVSLSFKVNQKPASCEVSAIDFSQVTLLDSSGQSIPYDSVAAMCFWGSIGSDPAGQGLVQAFTDKGGSAYALGERVTLYSQVTFGGDPVRNKLVAFEVVNPIDNTVTMGIAVTDQNGIATMSFKVPDISGSLGVWTAFSTVDLDQTPFWTTVNFNVQIVSPVGGYTHAVTSAKIAEPSAIYGAIIVLLTLSLVIFKPSRNRRRT
jgi:hypothetical protein